MTVPVYFYSLESGNIKGMWILRSTIDISSMYAHWSRARPSRQPMSGVSAIADVNMHYRHGPKKVDEHAFM